MVETKKSQYTEYNVQNKCSEYKFLKTQLCFHLFREYYFDLTFHGDLPSQYSWKLYPNLKPSLYSKA